MSFIESRRGIFVCLWTDHQKHIKSHDLYAHIRLELLWLPHTAIKCWQVWYVCLQVWIVSKPCFLLCIYTPPKTNVAIVNNQPVEDVSPIKQWWFVMICPYSTLVLLERKTSQPAATFPFRVPKRSKNVPGHRQAGKIQSSEIIHLEVSIFHSKKIGGRKGG